MNTRGVCHMNEKTGVHFNIALLKLGKAGLSEIINCLGLTLRESFPE
ncbi:MAG: hypothetical protein QOD58_4619 [Mycobacterium sp.]|jgi:hypothetical protein|nr:hypothetical protein [Mycobacterium sp.]MDT5175120.1 hypothetical protein [Mycobacterium sp.]